MRDSKPARPALDQRTGLAGWLQGRWWAWQGRKRLYQRYPIGFKMVAFFASWIAALALLMAVYWLYALA
jgi:hypothetical protein